MQYIYKLEKTVVYTCTWAKKVLLKQRTSSSQTTLSLCWYSMRPSVGQKHLPLLLLNEISRNNSMIHLPLLVFNETSFYSSTMRSPSPGFQWDLPLQLHPLSYFLVRPSNETFLYNSTKLPSTAGQKKSLCWYLIKSPSTWTQITSPFIGIKWDLPQQ